MSIPVPVEKLRSVLIERGGGAYLLTVSDDAAPHAVHVQVQWDGDTLTAEVGRRTAANAAARTIVSLLYPLRDPADYSVIVDGTAELVAGETPRVRITPRRAVMHRPAAAPDPSSSCGADCVPLLEPNR